MKDFKKGICKIILFLLFSIPMYAGISIVSPAFEQSRVWANKQVLLINTTDQEEVYYSISGTDPLTSGFIYDGPVLLDVTGEVELRITSLNKNKERVDYLLKYIVDESKQADFQNAQETEFINQFSNLPVKDLICGQGLDIPSSFEYSITGTGDKEKFYKGTTIKLSEKSNLNRYVSLTIRNNNNVYWNYVIHCVPVLSGEFSKVLVPFEIKEWTEIIFKDSNYIYSIDDSDWWDPVGKSYVLDRTVGHVVKWQNVKYDKINPINSYYLPPIPQLEASIKEDSTFEIKLIGDESYRFSNDSNFGNVVSLPSGLVKKIIVDAFDGENFSKLIPVDVYSENVYNGKLFASVHVNRSIPNSPSIKLSSETSFSREDIQCQLISNNYDDKIMYYIYGPVYPSVEDLKKGFFNKEIDYSPELFMEYNGKEILFSAEIDKPVAYKVFTYSIDKWNNVSTMATSDIYINKSDYFFDSKSNSSSPDGTFLSPFNNLSQIQKIINSNSFSRIYLSGKFEMPDEKITFRQNSKIVGINQAEIIFPKESSLYVINSSLEFENILIKKDYYNFKDSSSLITLENSVLDISNVDISFGANKNATMINSLKSYINVNKSNLNSFSNDYACALSAFESNIAIKESFISTVATTNVNISAKKSKVLLEKSKCLVHGFNSRVLELFSSEATILKNNFEVKESSDISSNSLIWFDKKSVLSESNNSIVGM